MSVVERNRTLGKFSRFIKKNKPELIIVVIVD